MNGLSVELSIHVFEFLSPAHAVDWFHYYCGNWDDIKCPTFIAAQNNWYGLLYWCQLKLNKSTEGTFLIPIENDRWRVVKTDNEKKFTGQTTLIAAANGHWRLFQWLIKQGAPVNKMGMQTLTKLGNLDMILWLYDELKLSEPTLALITIVAIQCDQLEILEWAMTVTNGEIWKHYCFMQAAQSNHVYIRLWGLSKISKHQTAHWLFLRMNGFNLVQQHIHTLVHAPTENISNSPTADLNPPDVDDSDSLE